MITMPIRVAISESGCFDFSDEAILLCVGRGMTLEPPLPEGAMHDDAFDFFSWSDELARIDGKKYGVRGEYSNEFRAHPIVLAVLEELGDRAMAADLMGHRCTWEIIEIPFDSIDGWHIRDQECGPGEYICEDHRTWSRGREES